MIIHFFIVSAKRVKRLLLLAVVSILSNPSKTYLLLTGVLAHIYEDIWQENSQEQNTDKIKCLSLGIGQIHYRKACNEYWADVKKEKEESQILL